MQKTSIFTKKNVSRKKEAGTSLHSIVKKAIEMANRSIEDKYQVDAEAAVRYAVAKLGQFL